MDKKLLKTIKTTLCTLRLDPKSGDLKGVKWNNPALEIIREPRLGENFRLLLPTPGYEANYFESRSQRVSRIAPLPDGVECIYDSLCNERGKVDVSVRYRIQAVDGQLTFSIEVKNETDLPLAEVLFGIIGGQQGIGERLKTESFLPAGQSNEGSGLFQRFNGGSYGGGNLGIRHSAAGFPYPGIAMPWISLFNRSQDCAIYFGDHDEEFRSTLVYVEVHPFTKSAALNDTWPGPADVPCGTPLGLTMGFLKMPYTKRGTFQAGPLALQVHRGDWREAVQVYRKWFDVHFDVCRPASWLRHEHAWFSVIMSNPEDVIVHRFKDLPRLAADAKKYGITTMEILGWDVGGIDRGYPEYRPDPRLGSPEDFAKALRAIKKIGVHPLIFTNMQLADTATEWFKKELHQYTVRGRWAEDLALLGWGEGTIASRLSYLGTNSKMTYISPAHPRVRQLHVDQFRELIRAGAEGLQIDKLLFPAGLDFNPNLPSSPDRSLTHDIIESMKAISEACRAENPDFALASEMAMDRALPYVDVSYFRMGSVDMDCPVLRYAFPEWTSTIFAESPGDFNVMNNGMRYGLVWAMAPRHYNDSPDEPMTRPLSRYVRELIRIRKRHEKVLFLGRYLDQEGATVKAGKAVRYSVFESREDQRRAVVVVNFSEESVPARVTLSTGGEVEVCQPFQPNRKARTPVILQLPPHSCAVVVAAAKSKTRKSSGKR